MPEKDKHANSRVPYSRELDEEDKNFIRGMESWQESTQLPMLTDKIIVLSKSIKKLNKSTTIFSIILSIFALIQIIVAVINIFN